MREAPQVPNLRASGRGGELRYGYQTAAWLGPWRLEPRAEGGFTLETTVLDEHGYWGLQAPLDLALALGGTEWVWRAPVVCREGARLTATLCERPEVGRRAITGQ